jgi:CubicO group peptidase (beta-lactamase class C family)
METLTMQNRIAGWKTAFSVVTLVASFTTNAHAVDLKPKIDPIAQPLVEDGIAVGFVVGIVKNGQTQVIAYGETAKGSKERPTAHTVYEIGSVSKAFTGVLLAVLVQQELVKLEDPVQKYVPDAVRVPVKDGQPMTMLHLATHTSGLPRMPSNFKPADPTNPYADYTADKMFEFLGTHQLGRAPGKHEYSNYGMGLLGTLLARITDLTYEQLMIKRICQPLGMDDTRVKLTSEQRRRMAPPYNAALQRDKNWDFDAVVGAGGIRSTCNDMLAFIRANLDKSARPLTAALRLSHEKRHSMDNGLAMGLGWHIARDGITRWHNGMTGGYHCWLSVVPDHGIGVVVLANTATMRITEFGEQVTRIAFGIDVKPPKRHSVVDVDKGVLEKYAGVYRMAPQFALTVTVEDGKLMVQATGQPKLPVFAESQTKFFYKVVDAQITFHSDKSGEVKKLILHQLGRDMEAIRER